MMAAGPPQDPQKGLEPGGGGWGGVGRGSEVRGTRKPMGVPRGTLQGRAQNGA